MIKYKYHGRLFYYGKKKERLTDEKNIIADLIREYDIQSAEDIQDSLKDLLGGTIESMLAVDMDNHLGYVLYERTEGSNDRNGKNKRLLEVNMEKWRLMYLKTVLVLLNLRL